MAVALFLVVSVVAVVVVVAVFLPNIDAAGKNVQA